MLRVGERLALRKIRISPKIEMVLDAVSWDEEDAGERDPAPGSRGPGARPKGLYLVQIIATFGARTLRCGLGQGTSGHIEKMSFGDKIERGAIRV